MKSLGLSRCGRGLLARSLLQVMERLSVWVCWKFLGCRMGLRLAGAGPLPFRKLSLLRRRSSWRGRLEHSFALGRRWPVLLLPWLLELL